MPDPAAQPYLLLKCDTPVGNIRLHADLSFHASWTTLFGPSGSGKSSLLRVIAGLLGHGAHTVTLHDRELSDMPTHLRRIGFVSQSPALFPHMSVRENISFGANTRAAGSSGLLAPSGFAERKAQEECERLLELFELRELSHTRPMALSGGETQRVALCRALLPVPQLLLLDESFSGLDRALRNKLVGIIRVMQTERAADCPMPVIAVTHDVAEIFATAGEVIQMLRGSIVAQGTPMQVLQNERATLLQQLEQHSATTRP